MKDILISLILPMHSALLSSLQQELSVISSWVSPAMSLSCFSFIFIFSPGMSNKTHLWSSWENKQKAPTKPNGAVTAWEVVLQWTKGQSSFFSSGFSCWEYLSSIKVLHLRPFVSILSVTKNWIIPPFSKNHSSIFKQHGRENLCAQSFGGKLHTINAVSYGQGPTWKHFHGITVATLYVKIFCIFRHLGRWVIFF